MQSNSFYFFGHITNTATEKSVCRIYMCKSNLHFFPSYSLTIQNLAAGHFWSHTHTHTWTLREKKNMNVTRLRMRKRKIMQPSLDDIAWYTFDGRHFIRKGYYYVKKKIVYTSEYWLDFDACNSPCRLDESSFFFLF